MTLNDYQTLHLFKKYSERVKLLNVFSEKEVQQFQNFLTNVNISTDMPLEIVLDVFMSIQWGLRRFARSDDDSFYYKINHIYENRFLYQKESQILPPRAFLAPYIQSYRKTYFKAYPLVLDLFNELIPKVLEENKGLLFKGINLYKESDDTILFKFIPISTQDKSLLWIP
jgi:hypothetical protein